MVEPKRVLHVGCGIKKEGKLHRTFSTAEWLEVRLDIDPKVKPDIVDSIVAMTTIDSASFDAVWSSHNLEHLEAHEVPLALKEFRRVLKPDGFLLITLPDLQSIAELVAKGQLYETAYESPAGPIAPIDMIFGFRKAIARGNRFMAHRTGFTSKTLGQAIVAAGFAVARVHRGKQYDLWAVAHVNKPTRKVEPESNATSSGH